MGEADWQVTNLEISKQLEGLGIKQDSLWYWWNHAESDCIFIEREVFSGNDGLCHIIASAFTVAELGNMLADGFYSYKMRNKAAHKYGKWVCKLNAQRYFYTQRADTEANARGKMLVYLSENKLKEG
ncbi:MAG: hypothetical protein JRJ39_00165 [Deltaproteobacteria bacterium]|nr:hypothetical protein [Deltaproteobacteria bacterium]